MPAPKLSLRGRALQYLAAREHSRRELARKLAPHAETRERHRSGGPQRAQPHAVAHRYPRVLDNAKGRWLRLLPCARRMTARGGKAKLGARGQHRSSREHKIEIAHTTPPAAPAR